VTYKHELTPEFHAKLLRERRADREAADVFVRICKDGRADQIGNVALRLDETVDGWRLAMRKVVMSKCIRPMPTKHRLSLCC
jgi:hypothetical protein